MPRGTTMGEIDAKYESILGVFKPDAIFIDYLQLMKPTIGRSNTDWLDVGKVSEELHEFCRKKDLPVVTAAQRKAAQKKSSGKRVDDVSLEDLGRSKMIGDNAAIVLIIGNREDEDLREDMEIHIPEEVFGIKEWEAVVVSNYNVATYIKEFDVFVFLIYEYSRLNTNRYSLCRLTFLICTSAI